jgi:hypothetical protein
MLLRPARPGPEMTAAIFGCSCDLQEKKSTASTSRPSSKCDSTSVPRVCDGRTATRRGAWHEHDHLGRSCRGASAKVPTSFDCERIASARDTRHHAAAEAPGVPERLKDFTTRHLGKSAAMIVSGELVSVHRIRSVIAAGKLQITSCGADVCWALHSKLVGKYRERFPSNARSRPISPLNSRWSRRQATAGSRLVVAAGPVLARVAASRSM